jgi:hypothetical protein
MVCRYIKRARLRPRGRGREGAKGRKRFKDKKNINDEILTRESTAQDDSIFLILLYRGLIYHARRFTREQIKD